MLLAVALLAGVGLGGLSVLGDRVDVETPWRVVALLGNLAAPWTLVAFAVGRFATSAWRGSLAGTVTSVTGVFAYYGVLLSLVGRGDGVPWAPVVWTIVALVAGPVMGACGAWTAAHRRRPSVAAVALPAAALLAEALWYGATARVWVIGHPWHRIDLGIVAALILAALAFPPMLLRRNRVPMAYALLVVMGFLGVGTFAGLQWLLHLG
jgi:hypothetical protein